MLIHSRKGEAVPLFSTDAVKEENAAAADSQEDDDGFLGGLFHIADDVNEANEQPSDAESVPSDSESDATDEGMSLFAAMHSPVVDAGPKKVEFEEKPKEPVAKVTAKPVMPTQA